MALVPQCSPAQSAQLSECASAINNELSELRRLLAEEFLPRAIELGRLLSTARNLAVGFNTQLFYRWASENVGLSDRSVRNYLRLFDHRDRLRRLCDDTERPPTSIDGCLALLRADDAEINPTSEPTEEEVERAAAVRAASAFKGTIERCQQAIADVDTSFLTATEQSILDAALRVSNRVRTYAASGEVLPPVTLPTLGSAAPTGTPLDRFAAACRELRATHPPELLALLNPHWAAIGEILTADPQEPDHPAAESLEPTEVVITIEAPPTTEEEEEAAEPNLPLSVGSETVPLDRQLAQWTAADFAEAHARFGSWSAVARETTNPKTGKPYSKQAIAAAKSAAGLDY